MDSSEAFDHRGGAGSLAGGAFVAACLALGASWGACAFGAVIASDAGMPELGEEIDYFLLTLVGFAAGFLAHVAGGRSRRIAPLLGTVGGATLGVYAAGYAGFELATHVGTLAFAATMAAFLPIGRWGREW